MEWQEKEKRHVDQGGIALLGHRGAYAREYVRYRNIRVKKINPELQSRP